MIEAPRAGEDEDEDLDSGLPDPPRPWSARAQVAAAVLWPSFLAACLATMLFFAFVDPELVYHATTPPLEVSRETGYAMGFFFFWFVSAISSAVSAYLLRTKPPGADA